MAVERVRYANIWNPNYYWCAGCIPVLQLVLCHYNESLKTCRTVLGEITITMNSLMTSYELPLFTERLKQTYIVCHHNYFRPYREKKNIYCMFLHHLCRGFSLLYTPFSFSHPLPHVCKQMSPAAKPCCSILFTLKADSSWILRNSWSVKKEGTKWVLKVV